MLPGPGTSLEESSDEPKHLICWAVETRSNRSWCCVSFVIHWRNTWWIISVHLELDENPLIEQNCCECLCERSLVCLNIIDDLMKGILNVCVVSISVPCGETQKWKGLWSAHHVLICFHYSNTVKHHYLLLSLLPILSIIYLSVSLFYFSCGSVTCCTINFQNAWLTPLAGERESLFSGIALFINKSDASSHFGWYELWCCRISTNAFA